MSTKKRDAGKISQYTVLIEDDEIKAELEAMTNLEYNLHADFESGNDEEPDAPIFSVRKSRNPNLKESTKHDSKESSRSENENHIQTYVPNATIQELQALIRQPASCTEDRYKILDARDRLMRARRAKSQRRLSMTKITRGVCPDMCPEKERLMREFQRQVAQYELLEGADYRINHETAVKQYSRSSADQEEPLPQDLRPVESLKMTMSYLLHEIADLCEESGTNLAEWYHFLWDRTRGVRKDITQQELCCLDSVELVEQCARFHIVCAQRLGAERISVFDKKINTENLTKCLQTLKYMYHDLRIKGVKCDNEPEFRAYVILLNLNSGNFMWDVRRLPRSVQKSPEIRFAIEVYSCVESNNYAKFFRLVRDTTYTNACILLRYFDQVRAKALSIMVKAYCRTTSTAFPLYELIDILGFEDENEAVTFCERVGLNLSNDELHVMLDRRNFSQPVTNVEQGRAFNRVEYKRISARRSIGLCIAGKRMPEKLYQGHRPHDSFDSEGYLKSESINAEDQSTGNAIATAIVDSEEQNDPCEYRTDEDSIEPMDVSSSVDAKKCAETNETATMSTTTTKSQTTKVPTTTVTTTTTTATNVFNIFKMQRVSDFSANDTQPLFGKRQMTAVTSLAGLKTRQDSIFGNRSINKPDEKTVGGNESSGALFSVASSKISQQEQDVDSRIFGNNDSFPRVPNIFAKCWTEEEKLSKEKNSQSSIFDQVPRKNIFANATALSSFPVADDSSRIRNTDSSKSFDSKRPMFGKIEKLTESRGSGSTMVRQWQEAAKIIPESRRNEMMPPWSIDRRTNESYYAKMNTQVVEDVSETAAREETNLNDDLYDRLSEKILEDIIDDCIDENCEDILDHEIFVSRKVQELAERARNRSILECYGVWRRFARRKRQRREALDQTPVWLQKQSVEECAKSLYRNDQRLVIDNMRRKRLKVSNDESPPLCNRLEPIESKIYQGIRENAKNLEINLPSDVYWKMVISWPCMKNRTIFSRYKKIIDEYIYPNVKSYRPNSYETIHACVNNLESSANDERCLIGTDGLLLIATSHEEPESIAQRLTNVISLRKKLMPIPVIIAVLAEGGESPRRVRLDDRLDRLLQSGRVSEYTVRYEETVDETVALRLIESATLWLAVNKSPPIPLEMDYSRTIVDACLTEELWLRILGDSSFNVHLKRALCDVKFVIDLHNEAVAHLIDVLLDPESLTYTDFPMEFKTIVSKNVATDLPCGYERFDSSWKREENRIQLERVMKDLLLPEWTFGWPIEDSAMLDKRIVRYCQECLEEPDSDVVSRNILTNIFLRPLENSASADETSFIRVLLEIIKEKISHLEPRTRVVYNKNHIRHFRNSPWWFKSSALTSYHERQRIDHFSDDASNFASVTNTTVDETSIRRPEDEDRNSNVREIVEQYEERVRIVQSSDPLVSFQRDTDRMISQMREVSDRFEKSLALQKSRSRLLDEKLLLALGESDVDSIL